MVNKSTTNNLSTQERIEIVNDLYLKCKQLLESQDFDKATKLLSALQESLEAVFEDEQFKNTVFVNQDPISKEQQAILLAVDLFLNEDVKELTLNLNTIKSELASMKTANKMKKAYGG
jgi:hypothetical protein